ncbi:MAG TPA: hypothetical protein VJY39_08350 [Acidisphaera sp.]|nr:hypothetical protein [Acidisphaera sp.]
MRDDRSSKAVLEPGQTLAIRGRRYVIDAVHTGRDGQMHVQGTWRGNRLSETVIWPYNDVRRWVVPASTS